jgi:hypothetical protein
MKRAARIVLLAMLLAAVPLRGYAGVLMALCESHHGGAALAEGHAHERGDSQHHDTDEGDGGPSHAASVCSICASCCAGAGLAPAASHGIAFQAPDSDRIPFLNRQVSGFVPEHLDRPPSVL